MNLKESAVELVEAMLEETSSHSQALAREIAGSLDLAAIYDTMGDFYELMQDREVRQAGFDDEAERGLFRAYHIMKHLQDYQINLGYWGEGGRRRRRRREKRRVGEKKGRKQRRRERGGVRENGELTIFLNNTPHPLTLARRRE